MMPRIPSTRADFATSSSRNRAIPTSRTGGPAGHIIGYEHSFIHTIADFVNAIVARRRTQPDFADGLKTQRILDFIQRAAR
jgi:predicted dehydrogenase